MSLSEQKGCQVPRKRQSDAAKIRALAASGFTKEEILAKGYTRQQWEGALTHTKPMGRPKKPRCPMCGAILKDGVLPNKRGA
jgi:hypothetical protein